MFVCHIDIKTESSKCFWRVKCDIGQSKSEWIGGRIGPSELLIQAEQTRAGRVFSTQGLIQAWFRPGSASWLEVVNVPTWVASIQTVKNLISCCPSILNKLSFMRCVWISLYIFLKSLQGHILQSETSPCLGRWDVFMLHVCASCLMTTS